MNPTTSLTAQKVTERRMSPGERLLAAGALLETVAKSLESTATHMTDPRAQVVRGRLDGFARLLRVIAGSIAVNVPRLPSTSAMDAARAEIVRLQSLLETRT